MRRRPSHARLLNIPAEPPAAHPEGWTEDPAIEAQLDALHDREWPSEEWLAVMDCHYPHLDRHVTWHAARRALRLMRKRARGEMRRLRYGPAAVLAGGDLPEFRRRLRRRARLRWLAVVLLYGIRPCRCGAFHVRAWFAPSG